MLLEDAVKLMLNSDWKDRFIAGYNQLYYRMYKLKDAIDNMLVFIHDEMASVVDETA